MGESETVIVPDFVGLPVHIARAMAAEIGLSLASGDPDGPGIGSRTWPGYFWVTAQATAAGSSVEKGSQVQILFIEDGQANGSVPV